MLTALIIVLCIAGFLIITAVCCYVAMRYTANAFFKMDKHPNERGPDKPEFDSYEPFVKAIMIKFAECERWYFDTPHEDISIKTQDGLTLHGSIMRPQTPSKKVLVMIPGFNPDYRLSREGAYSLTNIKYIDANLVCVETRAVNKVEGKYMTFGWLERFDMKCWIELLVKMFGDDCEIFITGVSSGATVAMMTAALPNLPPQFKGCIPESFFASMRALIHDAAKARMGKDLPKSVIDFVALSSKVVLGIDIDYMDVYKRYADIKVPMLFLQGGMDDQIPAECFEPMVAACPVPHKAVVFPKSMHGTIPIDYPKEYAKAFADFMDVRFLG